MQKNSPAPQVKCIILFKLLDYLLISFLGLVFEIFLLTSSSPLSHFLFHAGIPLSGHDAKGDAVPKDPKHPKVAVFFADSHTLFGSGWLYPLLNSMLKYEGKALAYPVIDILVAPPQEELTGSYLRI